MSIRSSQTEVQKGSCGSKRPPDLQNTKVYSWVLASDSFLLTEGSRMEPFCEIWEYIKYGIVLASYYTGPRLSSRKGPRPVSRPLALVLAEILSKTLLKSQH
jgi:hypothetical protein